MNTKSNMNLNEWRDRAYKTACGHGFHDKELSDEHFLCLIISELMEAVEADRKGRHADVPMFKEWQGNSLPLSEEARTSVFKEDFEVYIKDSVEDELSDACIRILDLCGLRGIDIEDITEKDIDSFSGCCDEETFTESIYAIITIPIRCGYKYGCGLCNQLNFILQAIFGLAKNLGIDLLWHIEKKMEYNELRPMLNGKSY